MSAHRLDQQYRHKLQWLSFELKMSHWVNADEEVVYLPFGFSSRTGSKSDILFPVGRLTMLLDLFFNFDLLISLELFDEEV